MVRLRFGETDQARGCVRCELENVFFRVHRARLAPSLDVLFRPLQRTGSEGKKFYGKTVNQPTINPQIQTINQPINQTTNQPINQSNKQPTNQPTKQSIKQTNKQQRKKQTNKPKQKKTKQNHTKNKPTSKRK